MRNHLLTSALIAALPTLSLCTPDIDGGLAKMDDVLKAKIGADSRTKRVAVVAQFTRTLTASDRRSMKSLDVTVVRLLPIVKGAALTVPERNLVALSRKAFVRRLSWDGQVVKQDSFTVKSSFADVAWGPGYGLSGAGVTVAVIDSGVYKSNDLAGRVLFPVGFKGATQVDGKDQCGHGTHVAGIVAGNGAKSTGTKFTQTFLGIAPGASVLNVPVLGPEGQGTVSKVIEGIQWVVMNKSSVYPPVRVLNLSLGHPVGESYKTDPLCQAAEAAWRSGITVVCAAGNSGRLNASWAPNKDNEGYGTAYGSINSPANSPLVITVGAMKTVDGRRANDRIATYSSRGPSRIDMVLKPDLVAPGNRVVSLDAKDSYLERTYFVTNGVKRAEYKDPRDTTDSKDYFRMSGTSMAAPVVSGAVALMLQKSPSLTPDTIKARLMISADKWVNARGLADPCSLGAGYLNIPAALKSTVKPTTAALSPTLSRDTQGNVLLGQSWLYGQKAIWGSGITDLRVIWGTKAIWGSNTVADANHALWGSGVWTNRAVWGVYVNNADISSVVLKGE